MVQVLRRLIGSSILDDYANLVAYVARGEARPAFKRAFDAQLAIFTGKPSRPPITWCSGQSKTASGVAKVVCCR
jgi:hypothetical protein